MELNPCSRVAALAAELQRLDPALALLGPEAPAELERLSRDYFDYSPVLVPQLQGCRAQLVAFAVTVEQVRLVAGACARHGVPLTVRGAGTGNYGQCVPLQGGLVLDLTGLQRLRQLDEATGVIEVEAGALMGAIEQQLAPRGRALRLVPSTVRSATIGGFIAGGSGGIGSLRWGFLRDAGNLLGLEVVTLEPEPRLLQLDAAASAPLNHAYGTNGILTALRLPTTEAVAWQQLVVGFAQWDRALAAAQALPATALQLNAITLLEAPLAQPLPWPAGCPAPDGEEHRLLLLAAPDALAVLPDWLAARGGALRWQAPQGQSRGLPLRELSWNHTTLHWRTQHKGWTYLQMLLPQPEGPCLERLRGQWGDDLLWHLEAVKQQGAARLAALPLVRWRGEEALQRLMADCRDAGAVLFNPHVLTVEDGGLGVIDADQVAAKAAYDPLGLLNPGKLRGWLSSPG
ncbi:FAD-binding oxidoreductase [Cyanobium sp. Alchichica 3B3-8F6]|uniref:FAD-binding oxidoreductase n=1 Tax=Cyanobium sp. Alchichica 3B3-8F6 TaxID=2823696 RepID=UPI0020CC5142|nr:FAD-binding oxidoreductase [Cyanobium sp. Alchichica 3B3-8F6]MCP9882686.1 FAD-binding oxidoreductase [Cyanobium sp. Alchichica 3B3-8F6]